MGIRAETFKLFGGLVQCEACGHDLSGDVEAASHARNPGRLHECVQIRCAECGASHQFALEWECVLVDVRRIAEPAKDESTPATAPAVGSGNGTGVAPH